VTGGSREPRTVSGSARGLERAEGARMEWFERRPAAPAVVISEIFDLR
jgi:hypothetical protein